MIQLCMALIPSLSREPKTVANPMPDGERRCHGGAGRWAGPARRVDGSRSGERWRWRESCEARPTSGEVDPVGNPTCHPPAKKKNRPVTVKKNRKWHRHSARAIVRMTSPGRAARSPIARAHSLSLVGPSRNAPFFYSWFFRRSFFLPRSVGFWLKRYCMN